MLTAFDYGALAIVLLSALQGMWRGFWVELFSLIGWLAAFLLAAHFTQRVLPYVPANLPGGELTRMALAFVAIMALVLLGSGVLGALLGKLTQLAGLRSVDRSLGTLFGLIRGVLLVLLVVALAGFTSLPAQSFWQNALLLPYAEQGVRLARQFLPAALADHVPAGQSGDSPASGMAPDAKVAPGNGPEQDPVPDPQRRNSAVGSISHI